MAKYIARMGEMTDADSVLVGQDHLDDLLVISFIILKSEQGYREHGKKHSYSIRICSFLEYLSDC
jgi:hypothetical protein